MSTAGDRLDLFPVSARLATNRTGQALEIAGLDLNALAETHGTPLYLYDQATMDASVGQYTEALAGAYPAAHGLTYAGKAFLCTAVAHWTQNHALWVDCTGIGEIEIARAGGVPPEHILVHGVNKSDADLAAAVRFAGTIVVDNLHELARLIEHLSKDDSRQPHIWLRFRPGMAVDTHRHTQTGQDDSKFGMSAEEVLAAGRRCREHNLQLDGLHFHQGSFFREPEPVAAALESALDLMAALGATADWTLSPGGGWGVAYHEDDLPQPDIGAYVRLLSQTTVAGCDRRGLAYPRLQLEPGRSLVARAGVALYSVGAVKVTGERRWLLLDGGLADNLRPALYGARYSAMPVRDADRPDAGRAWLAGPYCESGDILIQGLPLPDCEPGELIAVPVSGAYQLSMGSNYNGARRPAVVWLANGEAQLIQSRETIWDLYRRDRLPKNAMVSAAATSGPAGPGFRRRDQVPFVKYQALGNDYLVLSPGDFPEGLSPRAIRRICDRHYGAGADGVLLGPIESGHDRFGVRIFNPDGSEAETSGNGLRIFARFLKDAGRAEGTPFSLQTANTSITVEVPDAGGDVRVGMGRPSFASADIPMPGPAREVLHEEIKVDGQTFTFSAVSMGNPHCVIIQDAVSAEEARRWGPMIAANERFLNGTNVQFVQVMDRGNLRIEIWERGAGYTLASGSSSCAAAAAAHRLGRIEKSVSVHMPGGVLRVSIDSDGGITLAGPARKVFEGTLTRDLLET